MSKEQNKHTPGPWRVKDILLSGHSIVATKNRLIAEVGDYILNSGKIDSKEMRKNAKLIAKAPEMAEEIKQLKSNLAERDKIIDQLKKGIAESNESVNILLSLDKRSIDREVQKLRSQLAERERQVEVLRERHKLQERELEVFVRRIEKLEGTIKEVISSCDSLLITGSGYQVLTKRGIVESVSSTLKQALEK